MKIPPLSEKKFAAQVVEAAKLFGWSVYFTWRSIHSPKGWPDLVLVRPPRLIFAELKTDTGKLTTEQEKCLDDLRACVGHDLIDVCVWRPEMWKTIEASLRG